MLKKDNFISNLEATAAKLKETMKQVPILALPDFANIFTIEADASGVGLGVMLTQRGQPLAFFSQALTGRARFKSVYERELMAIILAIQKWRHYLLGRYSVVKTNQKSLKHLLEQRLVAPEYQRW